MSANDKILEKLDRLLNDFDTFANYYMNGKGGKTKYGDNGRPSDVGGKRNKGKSGNRVTDESDIIMGSSIDNDSKKRFLKELLDKKIKELDEAAKKLEEASNAYEDAKLKGLTGDDFEKIKENLDETIDKYNEAKESVEDLQGKLNDTRSSSRFASAISGFNERLNRTTDIVSSIYYGIRKLASPWSEADKAASKYAKTIGMTKAGMDSLRKTTIGNVATSKIAADFNVSVPELLEVQASYAQNIGRSVSVSDAQQRDLAAMHSLMQGRESELIDAFDNFGVNLSSVAEHTGEMFNQASKSGLSFQKYSDNVAKNIKIAQNYTFKNGLRGLESMAKKATALKMDMSQVASLADKVSTVEGSIDVASKLQVLGGPFASFADPLGMMTEGLTDMEGLFDRVVKMIGDLGTYDKQSGQVKLSAFNQQRLKAAAQAMGIDYTTLTDSANTQARRKEIERQIIASPSARGLNADMIELIKNTATINKNGKAVVSVNGEEKEISRLTNADYQPLIKATQDENKDIKDIAQILLSWDESIEGAKKQKDALQAQLIESTGIGDKLKDVTKLISHSNLLLGLIAGVQAVGTIGKMFGGRGRMLGRVGRGGLRGGSIRGGNTGKGLFRGIFKKKGASTVTNKVGENTVKQTLRNQGTKEIIEKGSEKAVTSGVVKGGLTAGKLMKAGGVVGIVGTVGNLATDYAVEKGKLEKGSAGHTAAKVGFTAAEGAGIGLMAAGLAAKFAAGGSVAGPIGTAVGAVLGAATGAIIGGVKMAKIKREKHIDEKLERIGIQRKGSYGARSYKLINRALDSGEISDRMRRKLERQGDYELLAQIDAKKKEREKEEEAKKDRMAERLGKIYGNMGSSISKGIINVGTAYINSKNGFGVEPIVRPKPEDGLNIDATKLLSTSQNNKGKEYNENRRGSNREKEDLRNGKIDINISGSIKLVGSNGQNVDVTDKLLSDNVFIQSITKLITKQIQQNKRGTDRQDNNVLFRS